MRHLERGKRQLRATRSSQETMNSSAAAPPSPRPFPARTPNPARHNAAHQQLTKKGREAMASGPFPFGQTAMHEENPPSPRQFTAQSSRSEEHTSELQSLMRISSAGFCLQN